jgi:hypothetical protein
MVLLEIMNVQTLIAQVPLILLVGNLSMTVTLLSAVIILMKNVSLQEFFKIYILQFFRVQ